MPIPYLAAMTLPTFNLPSEEVQLAYVLRESIYLARRWDDFHQSIPAQ